MRPQQQNRRMRGRNNSGGNNNNNNNNNRKGPNPLNRNYESNGPDVKIRGSAQQIAEKYATLARDAMSSGDRVMAENYLQHAEHYNRIIAAAQAQMPIQHTQQSRDDFDDDGEEDRDDFEGNANGGEAQDLANGSGPQPEIEGTPAEVALNSDSTGEDRGNRDSRENNGRHRRHSEYGRNGQRNDFRPRNDQDNTQSEAQSAAAPSEESQPVKPVAVESVPVENLGPAALAAKAELNEAAAESAAPRRVRRPRRPRVSADDANGNVVETETGAGEPAPAVSET
ncbi:hypothetical protein ASD64_11015 [Mesorhizobium sp. Root157]|uniref:DUF4167 domain-containing protein n=1 Tax=Mesorhizobium sp. Root157 TaxID=1736477 RepID=UPI0006FBE4B4|nr:DUF4167 domain-containing protein [Mesorhizobium sp. Root157]KQZ80824.1 hypothetical protein ASD64_11015 [Mesorhizobium sp. Root157]